MIDIIISRIFRAPPLLRFNRVSKSSLSRICGRILFCLLKRQRIAAL